MLMRKLGRTGLKVAALCLGGNTLGWTTEQQASEAVLDAYCAAGGDFIDTAEVYSRWTPGNSGGESETALRTWMKARGNRHQVIIATKVMGPMGPGPNDTGLSRHHIVDGVEASLRRLQTDYIDLYQGHWDDRETRPAPGETPHERRRPRGLDADPVRIRDGRRIAGRGTRPILRTTPRRFLPP